MPDSESATQNYTETTGFLSVQKKSFILLTCEINSIFENFVFHKSQGQGHFRNFFVDFENSISMPSIIYMVHSS